MDATGNLPTQGAQSILPSLPHTPQRAGSSCSRPAAYRRESVVSIAIGRCPLLRRLQPAWPAVGLPSYYAALGAGRRRGSGLRIEQAGGGEHLRQVHHVPNLEAVAAV